MSQVVFDENIAKQLEALYSTRDVLRRRALVRDALAVKAGEDVLDIGCGPGFYVAEVLDAVGPTGSVVGIDASASMLAIARHRCEGYDNVRFEEADATGLPLEVGTVDAALAVQVLEYVPDVPRALNEMHRVLRPGGRVVIWDVDWTTLSWHSNDPARMERILHTWDGHLAHPALPRTLSAALRAAGFADVTVTGHPFVTDAFDPQTYGGAIVPLLADFVIGRQGVTDEESNAWAAEQRELGDRGTFFFAITQFCFAGRRP